MPGFLENLLVSFCVSLASLRNIPPLEVALLDSVLGLGVLSTPVLLLLFRPRCHTQQVSANGPVGLDALSLVLLAVDLS